MDIFGPAQGYYGAGLKSKKELDGLLEIIRKIALRKSELLLKRSVDDGQPAKD